MFPVSTTRFNIISSPYRHMVSYCVSHCTCNMITGLLSIHQLVYFIAAHSVLSLRNCIFTNLVYSYVFTHLPDTERN